MALDRLIEGDVVGAGLDLTSGLGGPLTAIPALIASVARDAYSGIFGIPPEQDPAFAPKMSLISGIVGELVKSQLAPKIKPQQSTTDKQRKELIPPAPTPIKAKAPTVAATGGGGAAPAAPAAPIRSTGGGGGGGPMLGGLPPKPSTPPEPQAPKEGGPVAEEPINVTNPAPAPEPTVQPAMPAPSITESLVDAEITKAVLKGPEIAATSVMNDLKARMPTNDSYVAAATSGRPAPAKDITTRNGAKGMGDVPDPNYSDIGDIVSQLYFSAAG